MDMDQRTARATIRVRVIIDTVLDGRLVTADRWVQEGDRHPFVDVSPEFLLTAASSIAQQASSEALHALAAAIRARK